MIWLTTGVASNTFTSDGNESRTVSEFHFFSHLEMAGIMAVGNRRL